MKQFIRLAAVALSLIAPAANAALNILATVPEWAALAQEIGGDKVKVSSATTGMQDPHHIEARPSLISRARNADLLVANGAELEIGWLPVVLRESGNPRIQPGQPGNFEAASHVTLLGVPTRLDRADGDVHAAGNPHIQTDPRNILRVGEALSKRMAEVDTANAAAYRANFAQFKERWMAATTRWEKAAASLRGVPVVVQHETFTYLVDWLGLKQIATLEPKPGVEPSAAYLSEVVAKTNGRGVKMVIRAAYNSPRPAEWFAREAHVPIAVLPSTVGGDEKATDLFTTFDLTISRLLQTQP